MPMHLHRDLERLKRDILTMGSMVWDAINAAITALVDRRPELAQEVLSADDAIDEREVEIEEECLKLLALHQPVATDLRFIISILKVNNDLERMGDLAINIAERAAHISTARPPVSAPVDFPAMVESVRKMVDLCLEALVNRDTAQARAVLAMDDEVDDYNRDMFVVLQELMRRSPEKVECAVHWLSASRHLERIADLATNIAEDVVFMVEGRLIRHQHEIELPGGPDDARRGA
ncbi:MAG: phosphate signaling complex protein PhoU [Candidatus Eiseniibacteriota bacterium]